MSRRVHRLPKSREGEIIRWLNSELRRSGYTGHLCMKPAKKARLLFGSLPKGDVWKHLDDTCPRDLSPGEGLKNEAKAFYASRSWQAVRYKALVKGGGKCACCGRSPGEHGVALHVDHIKPRSLNPDLALTVNNLQVLCEDCNMGKSNRDQTDWR